MVLDINKYIEDQKKIKEAKKNTKVVIHHEVRVCYMGAFLSRLEAERFREEFLAGFEKDIEDGNLVLVQDEIKEINLHHVVRIMGENPQGELNV